MQRNTANEIYSEEIYLNRKTGTRYEIFTAVKIDFLVFGLLRLVMWLLYTKVACCLYLQSSFLKMEAPRYSETLACNHHTARRNNLENHEIYHKETGKCTEV